MLPRRVTVDSLPEPLASLIRDHRLVEEVVSGARRAIAAATAVGAGDEVITAAMEQMRDLDAFATVDLALHVAREEQVLFPAVRARAEAEMATVLTDMVAQHDAIRDSNAELRFILKTLDAGHDALRAELTNLASGIEAAASAPSLAQLASLSTTVRTLDAILQGHFVDEEVNVFEMVAGWFSPESRAELSARMSALAADFS
jgi:iron-sulfur cluster repair protein YtfE (RIC family)